MVLLEGATCHDISMTSTRLFDYLKDNAVTWAHHFAQSHQYPIANGSLYVITGVDKTSACANLAFPNWLPSVESDCLLRTIRWKGWALQERQWRTKIYHPFPIIYVFSCEARELHSAELNGLNMSMKGLRQTRFTPKYFSTLLDLDCPSSKPSFVAAKMNRRYLWMTSPFQYGRFPIPYLGLIFFLTCLFQHAFHPSDITDNVLLSEWVSLCFSVNPALKFVAGSKQHNRGFGWWLYLVYLK